MRPKNVLTPVCPSCTVWNPLKRNTTTNAKMATCNKEAGDKKGDERKAFMKTCLSAKKETQQSKMASCNKEAGEKKGDERKKFMSECLKAKPAA